MGNKVPKPQPTEDNFEFEVGISKTTFQDFFYSDFFNDPSAYAINSNKLLIVNGDPRVYRISPNELNYASPSLICSIISDQQWNDDIIQPVKKVVNNARVKKDKLRNLFLKNPHSSFQMSLMYRATQIFTCRDFHDPMTSVQKCCFYLCVLPLFVSYFVIMILAMIFGLFLDIITCKICRSRGSKSEVDWLTSVCQQHPELDTLAIDQAVESEIGETIQKLNLKYTRLHFSWKKSTKEVIHKDRDGGVIEIFDMFMISIKFKSNQ